MKKTLLFALIGIFILAGNLSFAQKEDLNCFEKYQKAFEERGAYAISDNIYRNVLISFFDGDDVFCIRGKVRVEQGYVTSIFYYYDDGSVELYDKKFANLKNEPPTIANGISEMIQNADRQKLRIIFADKLRPKHKSLQRVSVPDDL